MAHDQLRKDYEQAQVAMLAARERLAKLARKRKKNVHAVALGKLGGRAKSKFKARSSARNGRLGGRPKVK